MPPLVRFDMYWLLGLGDPDQEITHKKFSTIIGGTHHQSLWGSGLWPGHRNCCAHSSTPTWLCFNKVHRGGHHKLYGDGGT